MELKIDLLPKRKRSNFFLIMGVIGVGLAIIYLVIILHSKEENLVFQWINLLNVLVLSANGILSGLGYSPDRFFGSAYIHIDDQHIAIKPGIRKKEQSFLWNRIKSMEYKTNWFLITQTDSSTSKYSLSDLEFKVLIEVRDAIRMIAAEKGIAIN